MTRKIRMISLISLFFLTLLFLVPNTSMAAEKGIADVKANEVYIDHALTQAKAGHLDQAEKEYRKFRSSWPKFEEGVKAISSDAYSDIEAKMGAVDFALLQKDKQALITSLNGLKETNNKFIEGNYKKGGKIAEDVTMEDFLSLLGQTKKAAENGDQDKAMEGIEHARKSWLSVEGRVVSSSQKIYDQSESDLVAINAMLSSNPSDYKNATKKLENMITYLKPISQKENYSIWDAALIPFREGLEALLVVGALLAFANRSENRKGRTWVSLGGLLGLIVSIAIGVIVKLIFSVGAFGHNNFLISGWTGVIAAAMLLYMSYWLHSQSNISNWKSYIRSKSQGALNSGSLITLGILAFLAVLREGVETVLFIIGMVNQISMQNLLIGLLIGLGFLSIIAYLMIYVGIKLPLKPFFLISSIVVFYLAIKFIGSGIRSFQLAGTLPNTNMPVIPHISFISLYPSWQSALPQIMVACAAVITIIWKNMKSEKSQSVQTEGQK